MKAGEERSGEGVRMADCMINQSDAFSLCLVFSLHPSLITWARGLTRGMLCLFRVSLLSASLNGGVLAWEKWGKSRNGRIA